MTDANSGTPANSAGWFADETVSGWHFDARELTGNSLALDSYAGGYDTATAFEVILDQGAGDVYGRADFGSGFFETAHFAVSATQLASLNSVYILQDYRNPTAYLGAEFDNLLVTSSEVPIPAAVWLFGSGLIGLLGIRPHVNLVGYHGMFAPNSPHRAAVMPDRCSR